MFVQANIIEYLNDIVGKKAEKLSDDIIALPIGLLEKRIFTQHPNFDQTPIEQDIARIVYSTSLNILQSKTQVWPILNNSVCKNIGFIESRYSHSVKVAHTARRIAKHLDLNVNLSEIIGLAHDIGHLPFGHPAEYELNELLKNYNLEFNHDVQTFHVLTEIEKITGKNYKGLNLTYASLLCLLYKAKLGEIKNKEHHTERFKMNQMHFDFYIPLEAFLVENVDKIVYLTHDIGNALQLGFLKLHDIKNMPCFNNGIWEKIFKEIDSESILETDIAYYVKKHLYNYLKDSLINNFKHLKLIPQSNYIYLSKTKLIDFDSEVINSFQKLKNWMYQNIYFTKPRQFDENAKTKIRRLFHLLMKSNGDNGYLEKFNYLKIPNFGSQEQLFADIIWSLPENMLANIQV